MPTNTDLQYRLVESQGNWANLEHGQDTVAAAGTAEALNGGASLSVPDGATVEVAALPGNAGNVYVGDADVSAANGRVLSAGDPPARLNVTDVASVYVDVDTAGEGVSWVMESA